MLFQPKMVEEEPVEEKKLVEIKLADAKVIDTEDNQFNILFYNKKN